MIIQSFEGGYDKNFCYVISCQKTRLAAIIDPAVEIVKDYPNLMGSYESVLSEDEINILIDFIELGELMVRDALDRNESCGGHFREESQTKEGEALRDDDSYAFVSAWEYKGKNSLPIRNKEDLDFDSVHLSQRSYK